MALSSVKLSNNTLERCVVEMDGNNKNHNDDDDGGEGEYMSHPG